MSGRFATDERPVCVGDPSAWQPELEIGSLCPAEGTVSLLQLRPIAPDGHPSLVWLTVCPRHQRKVRTWMRESWSADEVDTFGTRFLVDRQEHVDVPEDVPILRVAVSA